MAIDVVYLPDIEQPASSSVASGGGKGKQQSFLSLMRENSLLNGVILFKLLMTIGFSVHQTTFPMVAIDRFGFDEAEMGFFMSFAALIGDIVCCFSTCASLFLLCEVSQQSNADMIENQRPDFMNNAATHGEVG